MANAVNVHCAAAKTAMLTGDEQQVYAQNIRVVHLAQYFGGELVGVVEFPDCVVGESALGVFF